MYWHGRLAYKRSALLSQFIIHRGVIITFMQAIFIIEFHFVPMPIYNGFLILGYSTIFTMLPVFSLILDEDISRKVAQRYPILYNSTREGNEVSLYSFLYWMFISLYQALVIMALIALTLMYSSFYMVTTVSFTCLVLI
jgi:phospholipid-translocating ATPase